MRLVKQKFLNPQYIFVNRFVHSEDQGVYGSREPRGQIDLSELKMLGGVWVDH